MAAGRSGVPGAVVVMSTCHRADACRAVPCRAGSIGPVDLSPVWCLSESAPQVVGIIAVGGSDFIEVDQGGEVDDRFMVG
jgi:hypothetical protein